MKQRWLIGLLMITMLLGPVASAAMAVDESLPGVRGSRYLAPSFPVSVAWDPGTWSVVTSESTAAYNKLELVSPWSRLFLEIYPNSLSRPIDCPTAAINWISERASQSALFEEPYVGSGFAAGAVRTIDNRTTPPSDTIWEVTCLFLPDSNFVVRFIHYTWTASLVLSHPAARQVISTASMTSQITGETDPEQRSGILTVDTALLKQESFDAPLGSNQLLFMTIQLTIENSDTVPSQFDLRNVHLRERDKDYPPDTGAFVWISVYGVSTESVIQIAPGESIAARMIFVLPAGANPDLACYQTIETCGFLGTLGLGGGGIRPRIVPLDPSGEPPDLPDLPT